MPETPELEELCSAIERTAGELGVTCSRDTVRPVVAAYQDVLAGAAIAFRVATGARHAGELDCRFLGLPQESDPYAVALANDLTAKTDHPVGSLLADLHRRCPVGRYGIDFGVVGGFKKTWSFFSPDSLQGSATLADIPSMPRGLAANAGFFAGHGLDDRVSVIGIDYQNRTMNVYFGKPPAECLEARTVLSMHRELGMPDPSERMLAFVTKAYGIYFTLSWDSPEISRIAYPVMTKDPAALPLQLDATLEKFVKVVPCGAADHMVFYAATSATGEYYKAHSYYQWRTQMYSSYEKKTSR